MNKYRIGTDIPFQLSVDDGVEFINLAKCTILKVAMFCDAQEAFAGSCTWKLNEENRTRLDCVYPGDRQVYNGIMRAVVIMLTADGEKKSYDLKGIFEIVATMEEANATEDTMTSAVLSAWQLPMSTLSTIVEAAINATEAATESAIAEISYTESTEDDGVNVMHVEQGDGTVHTFNIKNGSRGPQGEQGETGPQGPQGPQGEQGNPGSSQDYPFELENNLTTDDATKALSAAMGVQLEAEIGLLEAETTDLRTDVGTKSGSIVRHTICTSTDFSNTGANIIADSKNTNFGKPTSSSLWSATVYVNVSDYVGKTIKITRPTLTSSSTPYGLVFFTAQAVANAIVPGVLNTTNASETGYELVDLAIPANAVYMRLGFRTTELSGFQCYYDEEVPGAYTSGLGKRVQDLETEVADKLDPLVGATENDIATIDATGGFKDSGLGIESEISSDNRVTKIPDNLAILKYGTPIDAKIGVNEYSPATGNSYVYFPVANGEKLTIIVETAGGSGSQLYFRKTNSSTGQSNVVAITSATTIEFTATDDYSLIYFYSISRTPKIKIVRDGRLYARMGSAEERISALENSAVGYPIYYSLSTAYDGYHNAKRFFIYVNLTGNTYVRFRLGLYRPSLADTNVAKTYWRLEESALYSLVGDTFTKVTNSEVTTAGENEFVIRQTSPNKTDFTGGYHGDEFIYDENGDLIEGAFAEFFADGSLINLSADITLTGCNTFFYKERSRMVETANSGSDQTNVGRPIAWHEKRTEFVPGEGYVTENRLDLIESIPFYAFTGVCCISRWISEYAMGESDPLTAMGDGTETIQYQFSNYGNRLVYYKGNGYSARVTSKVIFGDDDSMQRCYVYNTSAYNKYYRTSQTLTDVSKFKSRMKVTFEKLPTQ